MTPKAPTRIPPWLLVFVLSAAGSAVGLAACLGLLIGAGKLGMELNAEQAFAWVLTALCCWILWPWIAYRHTKKNMLRVVSPDAAQTATADDRPLPNRPPPPRWTRAEHALYWSIQCGISVFLWVFFADSARWAPVVRGLLHWAGWRGMMFWMVVAAWVFALAMHRLLDLLCKPLARWLNPEQAGRMRVIVAGVALNFYVAPVLVLEWILMARVGWLP